MHCHAINIAIIACLGGSTRKSEVCVTLCSTNMKNYHYLVKFACIFIIFTQDSYLSLSSGRIPIEGERTDIDR